MALIQKNGLLHYIDESGNVYVLYPITTLDNVSGTGKLVQLLDGTTLKTIEGDAVVVAPAEHTQAASTITEGTFGGQVVANASGQTPSTSLLRNSKLVSAERNPTVNGEICWTYG